MGKQLEMGFKLTGGPAELKALADAIRGVGGASGSASADVSNLEKEVERLKEQIKQLSEAHEKHHESSEGFASDVKEFAEAPLRSTNRELIHLLNGFSGMTAVVGAAAVGLGVIAVKGYELVESQAEAAEQTEHLSIKLGLTVGQTERLGAVAKIAGVSVDALHGAARFLAAALEDESGQGKKTAEALAKLGVSTRDVSGTQREMGPVLLDVLEKLGKVESVSERTFLAQKVLPRGAAAELLPLIAKYGEFNEELDKLGVNLDENVTKNLAEGATKINEMSLLWDKFKKTLAGAIAPVIIPVLFKATQAIAGNQELKGNADSAGRNRGESDDFQRGGITPGRGRGRDAGFQEYLDQSAFLNKTVSDLTARTTGNFKAEIDKNYTIAQSDLDAGAVKSKAFMAKYNQTADAMKKQLEDGKKKAIELANDIKAAPPGTVEKRKEDEFKKQETENNRLETAIKKAEETKSLYQKLGDMRAKARQEQKNANRDTTLFNQETGAVKGLGFTGQDALSPEVAQLEKRFEIERNYLKELDKIQTEKDELIRKLGGGAKAKTAADEIFGPKESEALQKRTQEFDKQVQETFKVHNTEMDKVAKEAGEHAKKNLEDLTKSLKEIQKVSDEEGKVIADSEKKQLERNATGEQAQRTRQRTATQLPGAGNAGLANAEEDYQAKITLAKQLAQIELDAVNEKYARELDELNALQGITEASKLNAEIQLTGAKQTLDTLKVTQKLAEDIDAAKITREEQIATLQQNDLSKYHDEAGKLFDAITKGGAGFQKYIQNGLKEQGKVIFENLLAKPLQALGGVGGNIGKSSGLGDILTGSIFDPKKATNPAQTANTTALAQLTKSVDTLTGAITGNAPNGASAPSVTGGLAGSISDLQESIPSSDLEKLMSGGSSPLDYGPDVLGSDTGGSGISSSDFGGVAATAAATAAAGGGIFGALTKAFGGGGGKGGGLLSTLFNTSGDSTTSQQVTAGIGTAGVLFAGTEGLLGGIKTGGARGGFAAAGSVLGTAAALDPEPISKAVLGISALATGLISALFPDPKVERQRQITEELSKAAYHQPDPITLSIGSNGNLTDTDYRGNVRNINATPLLQYYNQATGFDPLHPNNLTTTAEREILPGAAAASQQPGAVIVNVTTMDAKSFLDNRDNIAEAVRVAIQDGHGLRNTLVNTLIRPH